MNTYTIDNCRLNESNAFKLVQKSLYVYVVVVVDDDEDDVSGCL